MRLYLLRRLGALRVLPLLTLLPPAPLCSLMLLEAFSVKAHYIVFGMCISYASCSPIMQVEVRIDS